MRRFGFGLRLQLVVALSVAFIIAFALLGLAAVQLGRRGREAERIHAARVTAQVLADSLDEDPGRRRFYVLADRVVGEAGIRGAEFERGTLEPWVRGVTGLGRPVEAETSRGTLRLWIRAPEQLPLHNLLLLYVAVTGGAILLLTYLALTYLIVRPIDAVTRASERLAGGALEAEVPVRGAAEVRGLATTFNDMARQLRTDRRALEQRLRELEETTRELEAAQEQVLRSARLASVGRLAAGVAHEIGNPLAAILGLIELAQDDELDVETRHEFLARIQKETERINGIIRDLLDFARQDAEEAEATADLAEVVENAVQLVAPQKDTRKLAIERRVADSGVVRGSADRLTQVVLNLLLNAADALDGEGEIVVEVSEEDGFALLAVSDSGPGIPDELLDTLFEPFVTSKPVGQGTGLGLAVCHTLVERLGGQIRAENSPEGGARFVVRLPLA
ncbi:MAG: HAMP domain-containing sensor histidine kinase [Myxococcota bacterium]